MNKLEFLNPEFFWFLLIPFMHILWRFLQKKNIKNSLIFSSSNFIPDIKSIKNRLSIVPYILQIISLILIIISLARPQTTNKWEENNSEGIDIIIAMDISGSMLAQDLKPNRLEASKKIAVDFIKQRKNDRIGLVIFSGKSFTQCPLTTDKNTLINLFSDIEYGMVDDGTAIGDGLGTSINRLMDSDAESKIIILLTDGENTAGKISPITASEIASSDSVNIKVYTIGVGTKGMAKSPVAIDFNGNFVYDYVEVKIDEKTLTNISEKTGGKYFRAIDNKSLEDIYKQIDILEKTEIETVQFNTKNEKFYNFSLMALTLLVISFILKHTYLKQIN